VSSMKKTAAADDRKSRKFPAEAYDYQDDVTKEAVDKVREQARPMIDGGEWEVIDGFGRSAAR
jgi:hypothetical protein